MTTPESENTQKPEIVKTRSMTFPDLREEMDRLWATMMSTPWRPFRSLETSKLMPTMDVFEKDGQLHVKVELPGMTAKDVEISISEGALTITGEKKEEHEVKEANYHRSERTYGKFTRQVGVPAEADADNATAKFADGLLEVAIPLKKVTPSAARKIEISGA